MLLTSGLRYALYGAVASASLISLSVSAGTADGVFGEYFKNIIRDSTNCGINTAITGFTSTAGASFGTQRCTTFQNIVKSVLGTSSAIDGQAVVGFNPDGTPKYGDVNWQNSGGNISYTGGNVGIGTTTPGQSVTMQKGLTINGEGEIQMTIEKNRMPGFALRINNNHSWTLFDKTDQWLCNWTGAGGGMDGDGCEWYLGEPVWQPSITSSSGNVGIGTSSPAAKLDVQGGDITIGKLGDTRKICLNGVCTDKIPDAQKGDILYAVRSDINSNQISSSYGATANERVNNLFVAAWKSGVQDVGAGLGWSAANIASWQSAYTDIDQMRASIRTSGSEWGTTLITGYLVPGLKNLGYANYVKDFAGGCVGTPIVMMCTEGYACAYETFQPNTPAFGIISCIAR